MPCKGKKKARNKSEVGEVGMSTLKALAEINAALCGEDAKRAEIPISRGTGELKLRSLANKWTVDKLEKGKYLISEAGMKLMK